MVAYSCLEWCENDEAYFWLSFIFRIFFGLGTGLLNVSILSITAIRFSINKARYQGWYLIAEGLGALIGPIIIVIV